MPSYLSVVMPMIHPLSGVYVKLLLPLDAEKEIFDRRRSWTWFPSERDALDANLPDGEKRRPENSFRRRIGLPVGDLVADVVMDGAAGDIWYTIDLRC